MEEVSKRLRIALDARGMKSSELSDKSGVDRASVCRYLKGAYNPKHDAIAAMSKALRVQPAWLMGYDIPMEKEETPEEAMLRKYRALDAFGRDIVDHILDAEYQRCIIAGEKIG